MQLQTKNTMDCPKCGKKGLVEHFPNHYHCLWCGFQKDLSETEAEAEPKPESSGLLPLLEIAFLILLLLL
jgi:ribosomal protein S27AE